MNLRFELEYMLDLDFTFHGDVAFNYFDDISSINTPFSIFETFNYIDQFFAEQLPVNSPVSGAATGAEFELSSLLAINGGDGTTGFILNGIDDSDQSGYSVSSLGDINGDGFDDIIIGAYLADSNATDSGESYVIFGKATGFGASFNLSSLLTVNGGDGSNGFVIHGIDAYDKSGTSVSSAGDINGDGFDDIIIGAPDNAKIGNTTSIGDSYVIYGSNTGFDAELDLLSLNGMNGFRIGPGGIKDHLGVSVSSVGDINGDDFDDIIIGENFNDFNGYASGASYIIFGKAGNFGSDFRLYDEDNNLLLDGMNGFIIYGIDNIDRNGISVVRRHIKWHRFRPGLRETLLIMLVDIKRRLCGIASVGVQ